MRTVGRTVLAIAAVLAMLFLAGCGNSGPSPAGGSRSAATTASPALTQAGSPVNGSDGGLTQAQFDALDPCSTLSADQMASLVGGAVGTPSSTAGPGPHDCQFSANTGGRSSPGSIQIAFFTPGSGVTPRSWIDGNESGYQPQAESGIGDYAVFDPALRQTQVAKGPIAIVVSGSPSGAAASDVESLQAQAAAAILQKIFG